MLQQENIYIYIQNEHVITCTEEHNILFKSYFYDLCGDMEGFFAIWDLIFLAETGSDRNRWHLQIFPLVF